MRNLSRRELFGRGLVAADALGGLSQAQRSRAAPPVTTDPARYFALQVVDAQTGRGVPMVRLHTTSAVDYFTDSNGWVAFQEPGLMNRKVYFGVTSPGYEFPADGFGMQGMALKTRPGTRTKLHIQRLNIAERLYRITGEGIYRDTVLLGLKPPLAHPLLDAQVTGQDGVLTAIYGGRLYWLYGDTNWLSYPLGNFHTTGATTVLPAKIDPAVGFNLNYFTGPDGFVRPLAPLPGPGVVWLSGLVVLPDRTGWPRMLARFSRLPGLKPPYEMGYVIYNDKKQVFEKLKNIPLDTPHQFLGYPSRVKAADGTEYIYFTAPYPVLRVKAQFDLYLDPARYACYSCLKPGTPKSAADAALLDRDAAGKLLWSWKSHTAALSPKDQEALIKAGKMRRDESPLRLADAKTGTPILLNNCSCFWNEYRRKYIMIASQEYGATMLGEVWYAEADAPIGPWTKAVKIITHATHPHEAHDFYNPTQHPFFDQAGGRIIYLEGSYVNTFSGNPVTTPRYEYNQIMYRLDLSDPRLKPAQTT